MMSNIAKMRGAQKKIYVKDSLDNEITISPVGLSPVIDRITTDDKIFAAVSQAVQFGMIALLSEIRKFPELIRYVIVQSMIKAEKNPSAEDLQAIDEYYDSLNFDEIFDFSEAIFVSWAPDMEASKKRFDRLFPKTPSPEQNPVVEGSQTPAN